MNQTITHSISSRARARILRSGGIVLAAATVVSDFEDFVLPAELRAERGAPQPARQPASQPGPQMMRGTAI
jgi:hypothetical protein